MFTFEALIIVYVPIVVAGYVCRMRPSGGGPESVDGKLVHACTICFRVG